MKTTCYHILRTLAGLLLALSAAAHATIITVETAGELGPGATLQNSASCGASSCVTLREAINQAASGDIIRFVPALDGATILLSRYTNCLATTDTLGTTCLPSDSWPFVAGSATTRFVDQFGPSAFFITDGKQLTIDAATGLSKGIVIARDPAAPYFRLFDVNLGAQLSLIGVTLKGGIAKGGTSGTGGGAMGAGGAIFNRGVLSITRSSLSGNQAIGGSGNTNGGGGNSGAGVGGVLAGTAGESSSGPNGGTAGCGFCNPEYSGGPGGFGGGGGGIFLSSFLVRAGDGGFGGGGGANRSGNGGFGGGGGTTNGAPGWGGAWPTGTASGYSGWGGSGAGIGGAIFNDGGTVVLTNVTLSGNQAVGGQSDFGNSGSGIGGALFNYGGSMKLSFVTMAGNQALAGAAPYGRVGSRDGAAVYSLGDGACATSSNGTNSLYCGSGGVATLKVVNSVVDSSVASALVVAQINAGNSTISGSGNVITSSAALTGMTLPPNLFVTTAHPGLTPFPASAGGGLVDVMPPTTPLDIVIDGASNCLDADGAMVTIDQRGVLRPQNGVCDIGAYESLVYAPPELQMAFGVQSIPPYGVTSLAFWIFNNNTTIGLTNIAFTNPLPSGLIVATPSGADTGNCGGTLTATAGSNVISLSGASIPLAGTGYCTFGVNVTATSLGLKHNVTGSPTSAETRAGTAASANLTVAAALDIDASTTQTRYGALTDGLLILRHMLGMTGTGLTGGVLGATATRTDAADVLAYLNAIHPALDIDGDNNVDPVTDGLLILRYMFGLRGDALLAGTLGANAARNTPQAIQTYLQSLMP